MSAQDILKKLPSGGFLKIAAERTAPLTREKRAALIRKGNELFNKGEFALAQRIFVTTKYSDGLIRIGDKYLKGGQAPRGAEALLARACSGQDCRGRGEDCAGDETLAGRRENGTA